MVAVSKSVGKLDGLKIGRGIAKDWLMSTEMKSLVGLQVSVCVLYYKCTAKVF